jgi:hypothetical protein
MLGFCDITVLRSVKKSGYLVVKVAGPPWSKVFVCYCYEKNGKKFPPPTVLLCK